MRSAAVTGIPVRTARAVTTERARWLLTDHVSGVVGSAWLDDVERARQLADSWAGRRGGCTVSTDHAILTIAVYGWGLRVLEPALRRMDGALVDAEGSSTLELTEATERVKRLVGVERLGFLAIFTCMILMRFGL